MKNLSQVRQLSNCFEFTFRKYLVRTGRRVFWCRSFRLATCQTSHLPWFARTKRGVRSILIRYQRWKTFIQAAAQTFGWRWRWRRKPSSPLDPERSGNTYQRERMPAWLQECWLARTAGTMRKQADGGKKKKKRKKNTGRPSCNQWQRSPLCVEYVTVKTSLASPQNQLVVKATPACLA